MAPPPESALSSKPMSESAPVFGLRVECSAGDRDEAMPWRFFLRSREIGVTEILDQWLAPDHRYFKVRGDDGAVYIIRHDVAANLWQLTLFDRNR